MFGKLLLVAELFGRFQSVQYYTVNGLSFNFVYELPIHQN